jgi:hypothetical protein
MIVVGRSGNNNIRHIVTYDRGERSVPLCDYANPPHAIPKSKLKGSPGTNRVDTPQDISGRAALAGIPVRTP